MTQTRCIPLSHRLVLDDDDDDDSGDFAQSTVGLRKEACTSIQGRCHENAINVFGAVRSMMLQSSNLEIRGEGVNILLKSISQSGIFEIYWQER